MSKQHKLHGRPVEFQRAYDKLSKRALPRPRPRRQPDVNLGALKGNASLLPVQAPGYAQAVDIQSPQELCELLEVDAVEQLACMPYGDGRELWIRQADQLDDSVTRNPRAEYLAQRVLPRPPPRELEREVPDIDSPELRARVDEALESIARRRPGLREAIEANRSQRRPAPKENSTQPTPPARPPEAARQNTVHMAIRGPAVVFRQPSGFRP